MAAFIFEGRDKTQRTKHEKIAMRNTKYAIDWVVGGYYNGVVMDGDLECRPNSFEDLAAEIYNATMNDLYVEGGAFFGQAPREMRFAGEKFVKAYIQFKLENDEDVFEILNA